jgi:hypothetical protein
MYLQVSATPALTGRLRTISAIRNQLHYHRTSELVATLNDRDWNWQRRDASNLVTTYRLGLCQYDLSST